MIVSFRARLLLLAISIVLFIPIAAIPLQDKASLEQFHTRTLAKWPSSDFLTDPAGYFADGARWIADRIYPIIQAATLENNFLFWILHVPPQHRVTLGPDGFIFLNGSDEKNTYDLFEGSCVWANTPNALNAFKESLHLMAAFARHRGISVDVVVIPTLPTLYGDLLPPSVPSKYRIACGERAAGRTPLLNMEAPSPVHFVYPFSEMHAARDDEAFYPKANFHPAGLSLKVARDTYLVRLGARERVEDIVERGTAPSEILWTYGVYKYLPVYTTRNPSVVYDAETNIAILRALTPIFGERPVDTHAYNNSHPVLAETALMISDSFGTGGAIVFAGAFRRLLHVGSDDIHPGELIMLISKAEAIAPIDRVIFLVNDSYLPTIVEHARSLASADAKSYR